MSQAVIDEVAEIEKLGSAVLKRIERLFDVQGFVIEKAYRVIYPHSYRADIEGMVTQDLKRYEDQFRAQAIQEIITEDIHIEGICRSIYRIIKNARDNRENRYTSQWVLPPVPQFEEKPKLGQMCFDSILTEADRAKKL